MYKITNRCYGLSLYILCLAASHSVFGSQSELRSDLLQHNYAGYQQNKVGSNIWLQPYISFAKQRPMGSAPGYKANTTGFLMGYEKDFTNTIRLGVAAGYAYSVQKSLANTKNHIDINNYIGMLYGINRLPYSVRFDWALSGGHNYYKGSRVVQSTPANLIATSQYIGAQYVLHATLNKRFIFKPLDLIPQINGNIMHARVPQYTETGAGTLGNTSPENDSKQYTVGVGLQAEWPSLKDQRTMVSEVHALAYYISNNQHFNLLSSSIIGAPALSTSTTTYRTTARIGASFKIYTNQHISLKTEYDLQVKNNYYNNIFFVIFKYLF